MHPEKNILPGGIDAGRPAIGSGLTFREQAIDRNRNHFKTNHPEITQDLVTEAR